MKFQKAISFLAIFLIIGCVIFILPNFIFAQSTEVSNNISSDLTLDLNLAKQDPAPEQQQIVDSESKQVEITTAKGETTFVKPIDTIAPEAKTESAKDVIHPEETTSEQVITKLVTVEVDENASPSPSSAATQESPSGNDNVNPTPIPGTNIIEPNDNAAPVDNSFNPNLTAPSSEDNSSVKPSLDTSDSPSPDIAQSPAGNPVSSQQPQNTSSPDNSISQSPTDSGNSPSGSTSDDSNTDNSVQGIKSFSVVNFFQRLVYNAGNLLKNR